MIYFKKNEDTIEKYQVTFSPKELENLKEEIIENCSLIEHKEYKSDYAPRFTNEIIKNFKSTPLGETKEYFEETRDVYQYTYDEYIPPYLVELINKLLNGNAKALEEILTFNPYSNLAIDEEIKVVSAELNTCEDISEKLIKLRELENLLESKKEGEDLEVYYKKLLKLIKFTLIDTLSLTELKRIEDFLAIKLSLDKPFVKALKK